MIYTVDIENRSDYIIQQWTKRTKVGLEGVSSGHPMFLLRNIVYLIHYNEG